MSAQTGEVGDAGAGKIRGAETARRTLRILEALATHQGIHLDELCDVVGLNKSTAYRLLRVLQEESYAERLPQGGYRIGAAVGALESGALLSQEVLKVAKPALQELAETTGETVTVHRRAGDSVVLCLGVESERHALRHVIRVGETNSLLFGAAGNAILASLDDAVREGILARAALESEARRTLEKKLATISARGYATSRGANHPGLFGIAASAHLTGSRKPELSVSVSGPEGRWTERLATRSVDALHRCCSLVSHLLSVPIPSLTEDA